MYNKFPFAPLHGLIVVEREQQHPQLLTFELHQFAWMMANATGYPSRIMNGSFANQVLAQMHLFDAKFVSRGGDIYVEVLPKKLDEEVAAGMVGGFGGVLTTLTDAQASYINVNKKGFKLSMPKGFERYKDFNVE